MQFDYYQIQRKQTDSTKVKHKKYVGKAFEPFQANKQRALFIFEPLI